MHGVSLTLDPVPASVPAARRWARDQLSRRPEYPLEVILLCLSELVTNALLHGRTVMTISLFDRGDRLRVEVADKGDLPVGRPLSRSHPAGDTTRGLRLVSALAAADGVERNRRGPGLTAWFEVSAVESGSGDPVPGERDDITA